MMSREDYFEVEALSNSGIGALLPRYGGSPRIYKEGIRKESKSMSLGSMIHLNILEPERFVLDEINRPSDTMALWAEKILERSTELTEEVILEVRSEIGYNPRLNNDTAIAKFEAEAGSYFKRLVEKQADKERIYLTPQFKEIVDQCTRSVKSHPLAFRTIMSEGESELPVITDIDGVPCKGLIDKLTDEIIDLKTTSKPINLFYQSFVKYQYFRQIKFYQLLVANKYNVTLNWKIVAIQTTPPYQCKVFDRMEVNLEKRAMMEIDDALFLYKHYTDNGWLFDQDEAQGNIACKIVTYEDNY